MESEEFFFFHFLVDELVGGKSCKTSPAISYILKNIIYLCSSELETWYFQKSLEDSGRSGEVEWEGWPLKCYIATRSRENILPKTCLSGLVGTREDSQGSLLKLFLWVFWFLGQRCNRVLGFAGSSTWHGGTRLTASSSLCSLCV